MHALGLEFGSAAQLSKRPGSVWNCLWGNALKRSPGIIRKSRVLYPGPGFLSSVTWPSLPKKHYNGLNQTICMKKKITIKSISFSDVKKCVFFSFDPESFLVCFSAISGDLLRMGERHPLQKMTKRYVSIILEVKLF